MDIVYNAFIRAGFNHVYFRDHLGVEMLKIPVSAKVKLSKGEIEELCSRLGDNLSREVNWSCMENNKVCFLLAKTAEKKKLTEDEELFRKRVTESFQLYKWCETSKYGLHPGDTYMDVDFDSYKEAGTVSRGIAKIDRERIVLDITTFKVEETYNNMDIMTYKIVGEVKFTSILRNINFTFKTGGEGSVSWTLDKIDMEKSKVEQVVKNYVTPGRIYIEGDRLVAESENFKKASSEEPEIAEWIACDDDE